MFTFYFKSLGFQNRFFYGNEKAKDKPSIGSADKSQ